MMYDSKPAAEVTVPDVAVRCAGMLLFRPPRTPGQTGNEKARRGTGPDLE
jgi:hypothetical protein